MQREIDKKIYLLALLRATAPQARIGCGREVGRNDKLMNYTVKLTSERVAFNECRRPLHFQDVTLSRGGAQFIVCSLSLFSRFSVSRMNTNQLLAFSKSQYSPTGPPSAYLCRRFDRHSGTLCESSRLFSTSLTRFA